MRSLKPLILFPAVFASLALPACFYDDDWHHHHPDTTRTAESRPLQPNWACHVISEDDLEGSAQDMMAGVENPEGEDEARDEPMECEREEDDERLAACAETRAAAMVDRRAFSSIGDALAAVEDEANLGGENPEAEIWVCPGVHRGGIRIESRRSIALLAVDPSRGATVIDGEQRQRLIEVDGGSLRIDGFRLQNGFHHERGGAILATSDEWRAQPEELVVANCDFMDNVAGSEGGAISTEVETRLSHTRFIGNQSRDAGGAVDLDNGWHSVRMHVTSSRFAYNHCDGDGGAISIGSRSEDTLHLEDTDFVSNRAHRSGGAIVAGSWSAVSFRMEGGCFVGNSSENGGAAVDFSAMRGVNARFRDVMFIKNQCQGRCASVEVSSHPREGSIIIEGNTAWVRTPERFSEEFTFFSRESYASTVQSTPDIPVVAHTCGPNTSSGDWEGAFFDD